MPPPIGLSAHQGHSPLRFFHRISALFKVQHQQDVVHHVALHASLTAHRASRVTSRRPQSRPPHQSRPHPHRPHISPRISASLSILLAYRFLHPSRCTTLRPYESLLNTQKLVESVRSHGRNPSNGRISLRGPRIRLRPSPIAGKALSFPFLHPFIISFCIGRLPIFQSDSGRSLQFTTPLHFSLHATHSFNVLLP